MAHFDIYLQHTLPVDHEANWLPAPTGRFYLVLRLYMPQKAILDDTYHYPRISLIKRTKESQGQL